MKYEIKHTCGHVETVDLFGKMDYRAKRVVWLETQSCPECAMAAFEKRIGAVELVGSEKQVKWARNLRERLVAKIEEIAFKLPQNDDGDRAREAIKKAIANIAAVSFAKWFIDGRETPVQMVLATELKKIVK